MSRQFVTDRTAVAVYQTATGVYVERHSWLGKRSKRMPDAVNGACYGDDELRPLAAALLAEADERDARKAAGK